MDAASGNSASETQDRLALLLIAQPREGWEREFQELIRREIERLAVPADESGRDEHP
jgi:septum formation topological specificity factor MinE